MEVEMPAILTIFTRSKEMDCTHPKQSTRLQNRSDPMGFYRLRLPPNFPHHMTGNPDTAVNGHRSIACCLLPVACCDTEMDTRVPVAKNKEACSKLPLLSDGSYFC